MHACFEVDQLESIFKRMQDAGIKFYGLFRGVSQEEAEGGAEEGVGTVFAYIDGLDAKKLELIAPQAPFVR
jgi:hypothetical protein